MGARRRQAESGGNPKGNNMTLIGKWITVNNPDDNEYFMDGQISEGIGTEFGLVRMRNVKGGPSAELFRIFPIALLFHGFLFETEGELDRYLKWLDTPDDDGRPRVVAIRKERT